MKYSGKLSPFPEFTSDISHLLKIFVRIKSEMIIELSNVSELTPLF